MMNLTVSAARPNHTVCDREANTMPRASQQRLWHPPLDPG